MPIYRVVEPHVGVRHLREWRRRVLRTVALLLGTLAVCAVGMTLLDNSGQLLPAKLFRGLWNALNLVTTLGDFTSLDQREKLFMMATMFAFLMIGGYALSNLTGYLSSDAVMTRRENKSMEHKLERLAGHVIVIGFGTLGRLVAARLRAAGEPLVIIERADDFAAAAASLGYLVVQGDAGGRPRSARQRPYRRRQGARGHHRGTGSQAVDYPDGALPQSRSEDHRDRG